LGMERKRKHHILGIFRPAALFAFVLLLASELSYPPSPAQAANAPSPIRQQSTLPDGARVTFIETEFDSMAEAAEEIFNLALAGNLDRAGKRLDTLKKKAAALDRLQDEANLILLPRLRRTIVDLEKAMAAKSYQDLMRNSNRITLIAATVAVPYKPRIPTEVSLLEYNGRELEIWSAMKRVDKLSGIVIRMHVAWQTLMPKLIEHNGDKELKRFSELMRRLEQARTAEEYDRLSKQIMAGTATLEAIFAKPVKYPKRNTQ
jgi:hypothetical protein